MDGSCAKRCERAGGTVWKSSPQRTARLQEPSTNFKPITVTSTGTEKLSFSSIAISAGADFIIGANTCSPAHTPPGGSCQDSIDVQSCVHHLGPPPAVESWCWRTTCRAAHARLRELLGGRFMQRSDDCERVFAFCDYSDGGGQFRDAATRPRPLALAQPTSRLPVVLTTYCCMARGMATRASGTNGTFADTQAPGGWCFSAVLLGVAL